ncbi:MAG TPA: S8 family serine peptidase [Pyrinomonadaceae bacterium]
MRKLIFLSLAFAVSLMTAGSFLTVQTSGQKYKLRRSNQAIANKYIVVLNEDAVGRSAEGPVVEAEAQFLSSVYGGSVRGVYANALKGYAADMTPEQAETLSRDERVQFVEEDSMISVSATQTGAPWHLDRVDQRSMPMDTNFSYTNAGAGSHIYILDTGIRVSHQEFGGRASVAYDALDDGQNGLDCNGHGTHVAGIAAGATYGAAKNAFVHSVRVLPCPGGGQISDLIEGIDWLTANRINPAVANISITAPGTSPAMESAITNSIASGITYTIAAGNSQWNACDFTPARTPNAITVGASAEADERALYSNFGPCLDLFAPGNAVTSASIANDSATRVLSGTSMAAPLIAGVAAVYRAANPGASPANVAQVITGSATTGVVSNIDSTSPNKLLYSWLSSAPAPTPTPTATPSATPTPSPSPSPTPAQTGRITIKKRVNNGNGPTSTTEFPYQATNISTSSFSLVSDQEFTDPSVPGNAQIVSVTESSVPGWRLVGIACTETAGGSPNIPNTTVDLANQRANIMVENDETVTCTFTSEEIVPTAGEATITGRITDEQGRGVRGVKLSLLHAASGHVFFATSNNFGFYAFDGLEVSTFYVLTAYGTKRFRIGNNERSFVLTDDLANVDFLAENARW